MVSLSLAWLWRQGCLVKGERRKAGRGKAGKEEACWRLEPSCHTQCHWDACSALISLLVFVVIDHNMHTERE